MKQKLHIIKIGGNAIDDAPLLDHFLSNLSAIKEPFILVHGGGKLATSMSQRLGVEPQMIDGRRITDEQTLEIVVMVYAGWINKSIVAKLQANKINAIGLCGADADLISATLRSHATIDYGKVGDVQGVNIDRIDSLLQMNLIPVIAPITHDGRGQLLNTNADSIASSLAIALSGMYKVHLQYCFEKKGVLRDINNEYSVIPLIDQNEYQKLKTEGIIHSGMIPKLDNAFRAIENGVAEVNLVHAFNFPSLLKEQYAGTKLVK